MDDFDAEKFERDVMTHGVYITRSLVDAKTGKVISCEQIDPCLIFPSYPGDSNPS